MPSAPYTLLVLGGSSAIALAYVRQRLTTLTFQGLPMRILLLGRDQDKLQAEAGDLQARGAEVIVHTGDLSDPVQILPKLADSDAIDEVILAYGTLTNQPLAQNDHTYLVQQLTTNFTSAAVWLETVVARFTDQGHGKAVVIGSVAGDRGRQSNYIYGAAKGGLDQFVQGLQHRLAPHKTIHVCLVKPGFVDSPMTAHITAKGALWAKPEDIAKRAERALLTQQRVIYAPRFWRAIMAIIRNVPAEIFYRTKL